MINSSICCSFVPFIRVHVLDVSTPLPLSRVRATILITNFIIFVADSLFYRPAASAMNIMLSRPPAAFNNLTFLIVTSGRIEVCPCCVLLCVLAVYFSFDTAIGMLALTVLNNACFLLHHE